MRLLILSCSATKRAEPGLLPAISRYDGVAFHVLRKALGTLPGDRRPRVRILSAEFGLLTADTPIPWYDRKMDPARASELAPQVRAALRAALAPDISAVFVALGRAYLPALGELPAGPWPVTYAEGGIGRSPSARDWAVCRRVGQRHLLVPAGSPAERHLRTQPTSRSSSTRAPTRLATPPARPCASTAGSCAGGAGSSTASPGR